MNKFELVLFKGGFFGGKSKPQTIEADTFSMDKNSEGTLIKFYKGVEIISSYSFTPDLIVLVEKQDLAKK